MKDTITDLSDEVGFLGTATARFERLYTEDFDNRKTSKQDLEFTYNVGEGQWPSDIRNSRAEAKRPCLTSNKLRKFAAQTANKVRDQRLAGNVRPVDSEGDVETAAIYSDLIRQRERVSGASKIYRKAFEHAIAGTFGCWRITAEELPDSFNQELFIREIENQLSTYLDVRGMFGFIRERLSHDEFKAKYPKARAEDFSSYSFDGNLWYTEDAIFISEYFYKERQTIEIVQARNELVPDVKVFELGSVIGGVEITEDILTSQGWVIEKRKRSDGYKVKWAKITQHQVLESGDWMGEEIPIVIVEGDWVNIDGRLYKRSLITDSKDDQRMHNYWLTSATEKVALSFKAPYLVTKKMIAGLENIWNSAHSKILDYLPFKRDGNLTPRREPPPQVPTGDAAMIQITGQNIQDTIGKYGASFGERSNEKSGVAIRERAKGGDVTTFHFEDNAREAVIQSTKILIDLIPKIYDAERTVRLLGDDIAGGGTPERSVVINHAVSTQTEEGDIVTLIENDLSAGEYDLIEDVKVMSTRRQETQQLLADLSAGSPQLSVLLAPYIVELTDMPLGMGNRIKGDIKENLQALLGQQNPQGPPPEGIPGQ